MPRFRECWIRISPPLAEEVAICHQGDVVAFAAPREQWWALQARSGLAKVVTQSWGQPLNPRWSRLRVARKSLVSTAAAVIDPVSR